MASTPVSKNRENKTKDHVTLVNDYFFLLGQAVCCLLSNFKHMNNKAIHILNKSLLVLALLSLSACSDFLYQEPDQQISIEEQFSTKDGLHETLNGMYKSIEALVSDRYFVYADMMGGNMTFSPSSTGQLSVLSNIENAFDYNDTEDDSDYSTFYESAYDIINQSNLILEHLYDAPDVSDAERQQVKSEALASRGFTHFLLTLLYGQNMSHPDAAANLGVVYNTKVLQAGVDYPARETKATTYNMILTDIRDAINLHTVNQALNYGPSTSYFNPINMQALIARIALDHNDWDLAYAMADSTIQHSGISLISRATYVEDWKSEIIFPEMLLEFTTPLNEEGTVTSSVESSFFNYTAVYNELLETYIYSDNLSHCVASADLMALLDSNDIRRDLYLPITMSPQIDGVKVDSNFYFVEKFQNNPGTSFMRLSEMYLTRAEAAVNKDEGNLGLAIQDLNTIRERAGLEALDASTDIMTFREELYQERRRELAFEGHLIFDHMRMQRDVTRGDDAYGSAKRLNYPNSKFVLPLPESTLAVNNNMIQNEDY